MKPSQTLPLTRFMDPTPDENLGPRDFSVLYRATLAPLRRYLTRLLGNPSEAQDVAHDAYLRVYPSLGGETIRNPEALLYTAARRLAINRLKRRSISPLAREEFIAETAVSPDAREWRSR